MSKIITAALLCIALPAAAQGVDPDASDFCETLHGLSKAVMTARQAGSDMPDLMRMSAKLGHNADDSDLSRALAQQIIIEAFEVPRFDSETDQQREVTDFANDRYLLCVKAFQTP